MANRYWVGGSANWDATAGSKWALTSGGAGGQATPTSSDDVFLDASSGAVTVTVTTTAVCNNINCTGFTGTLAGGSDPLNIYGSLTLGAGMTSSITSAFFFKATTTGHTVTTNGISLVNIPRFDGLGGGWTLQDALTTTNDVDLYQGALNTNGFTVTCNNFYTDGTTNGSLTLGASTIVVGGSFQVVASHPSLTIDYGTSTIKYVYQGASVINIASLNEAYYNIWIAVGTAGFKFQDSNSFNNIKIDPNITIYTTSGKTVTYASLTATGTAGNLITFVKSGATGYTWTKTGGGIVSNDYTSISYMTASPASTFYVGTNSTDGGNNTQVYFSVGTTRYKIRTERDISDAQLVIIGNTSGTNTGDQTATTVSNIPAGNIAATTVQAAINELDTEKASLTGAETFSTGLKTFLAGMFALRNVANTFNALFTNTNTADRTYTLQDSSDTLVGRATTDTLTNKAITKRVITTTDDATAVIDVTLTDVYELSAVANATTFSTTGTPVDGQQIIIRFKDAGVAKGLTWDAIFVAIGVTLPTTTVAGKWHYVGCSYNSAASKFHVTAVTVEP